MDITKKIPVTVAVKDVDSSLCDYERCEFFEHYRHDFTAYCHLFKSGLDKRWDHPADTPKMTRCAACLAAFGDGAEGEVEVVDVQHNIRHLHKIMADHEDEIRDLTRRVERLERMPTYRICLCCIGRGEVVAKRGKLIVCPSCSGTGRVEVK